MSAATATLHSAPEGSKVRINYAAENGDAEIEPFFKKITGLFATANHWQVETERIGKSTFLADGTIRADEMPSAWVRFEVHSSGFCGT